MAGGSVGWTDGYMVTLGTDRVEGSAEANPHIAALGGSGGVPGRPKASPAILVPAQQCLPLYTVHRPRNGPRLSSRLNQDRY
eukprot:scaffold295392_cov18-Prasinocladus_malaysianus.AAC.1